MSLRQSTEEPRQPLRDTVDLLLERWREELAQLWADFRTWIAEDRDPLPVITFDEDLPAGSSTPLDSSFERRQRLGAALARAFDSSAKRRNVVVEFPKTEVLRTRVQLPKARSWTLRKVLTHELTRLSPIEPERLYFDFFATDAMKGANRYDVEIRIIKRDLVDDVVAICKAAGARVAAIQFAEDARPGDWRNFPVDRLALAELLWRRWSVAALATAAAILVVSLFASVLAREASWSAAVSDALDAERARALVVERLERKAATVNAVAGFVARRKQTPLFVDVLTDVSKILPDNSWITQLTLSGNHIRLEGYSSAAADLIAIFDRSPRFANAEFTAPLTRDDQTASERFDLSFDVRSR